MIPCSIGRMEKNSNNWDEEKVMSSTGTSINITSHMYTRNIEGLQLTQFTLVLKLIRFNVAKSHFSLAIS